MGLLDNLFGGRISNPALLSALAAYHTNGSDENLVEAWHKLLKSKVLMATSPEGAKSFSKAKQIRDAISIPFQTDTNGRGDIFLALFSDNQTFEQSIYHAQTSVIITGEDAFLLASSKGLLGLSINPRTDSSTELKIWQHLIFIEKLADANKLNALATKLARSGNHADAEGVLKGAISAAQRDPGPSHPVTAELNIELGKALRLQGKLNEAEWVYKRALGIYENCRSHDLEVATTSETLALLYVENNKAALSVPLFVRALEILESVPGAKPDSIGRMLCQLAEIKMQENQYEDAEGFFKRACLSLEEKKHPEVVAVSNKLAAMFEIIARPKEAVVQYSRSLALPDSIKRCKDMDIAFAAYRSALILIDEGKQLADAENLLLRALDSYRNENSTADIERTLQQLEELKQLISEQRQKNEETEAAQAASRGRFGAPGKRAPELLDFAAIKNSAPKATYAPEHRAEKEVPQTGGPSDPEEQALARMRDFLNSVGDPQPEAQTQPNSPVSNEWSTPPVVPTNVEQPPVQQPPQPQPSAEFQQAQPMAEPEPEPDMQALLNRAGSNINRAEAALDLANKQPVEADDHLDTDTLFALAKKSITGLKSLSEMERTSQEIDVRGQLESSIPPPVPKPESPANFGSTRLPSAAEPVKNPASRQAEPGNTAGSTRTFGKDIAGEISSVFDKSIFGNAAKSERFDTPIAKSSVEPAQAEQPSAPPAPPIAAAAPVAAPAAATTDPVPSQAELQTKSLFGAPVDAEISQVFNRSVLGEMAKSDRFDNPIPRANNQAPTPLELPTPIIETTATQTPELQATPPATPEPTTAAKETAEQTRARYDTPIQERTDNASKNQTTSLFDQEIDDSLTDAFNSLLAEPHMANDPYERSIQDRLPAASNSSSGNCDATIPAAQAQTEPAPQLSAEASLFADPLDNSLNDAFAKIIAEPTASARTANDRYDTPIQERQQPIGSQTSEPQAKIASPDIVTQPAAPSATRACPTPPAVTTSTSARTPEDLIKLLEQQLQADPENSELWLRKGTALVQQQRLDEAIKVFDKVTSMRPNDVKAWYCKGSSLHLKNQHEDALYCFNHVLNLDKENVKAMLRKAECLFKLGRADQGMVIYDRILLLQPKFVAGWLSKARALVQQRKLDDAKSCYDQVLLLDPINEEAIKANNLITTKLGAAAGN